MPAPTNTSAGTAVELGPLPATVAQQVDDAGTTYTVWYKYTPPADQTIGVWFLGDLTVYMPTVTLFQADGVTPYVPVIGGGTAINKRLQVPVASGAVVLFKVAPNGGNPSPANLSIDALVAPTTAIAAGDILINDDAPGMPGCIVSQADGSVKQFILDMANGEGGAILPSARFALTCDDDPANDNKFKIYDADGTLHATVDLALTATGIIGSSDTYFYPVDDNSFPAVLYQIDEDGATITSWNAIANTLYHVAPSRDDTILYYVGDFPGVTIKRWDLIGNVALSDLYALPIHTQVISGNEGLLVLSDGSLIVAQRGVAPGPVFWKVLHLSDAGAVLDTYDLTAYGTLNRIALNKDDTALSFHAWSIFTTNYSNVQEIRISDGTILQTTGNIPQYEKGAYRPAATLTPEADFGPSFSCPFLIMREAPAVPGTIIVEKVTNPDTDTDTQFTFTTDGLTPTTFTLKNGESQTFEGLTPGTYGIEETGIPVPWQQTSIVVSNDDPPDAIVITGSETVTVTVTNQRDYHVQERIIRRLRRAPHITQDDKRLFVSQFNLILQAGVGNVVDPGLDPKVMLRVSHDAGHTWEPEQEMSAGELGHYRKRVLARQLGQARDLVFEITVSDPVAWYLVEAFLDVEQGLH